MPPRGVARRPASLAGAMGLVLLVTLASLPLVSRLRVPPAVRTVAVGRVPTAVAVDARTRRVFVANFGSNSVSVLDAEGGTVLATVAVAPHPGTLAVATTAGRVFAVSDDVTLDDAGRVSVLDATSGRLLRSVAVGRGMHTLAVHQRAGRVFVTNAGEDSVSLLDASSRRLLRTIPVGLSPLAGAVDEPLKRVFVANGGVWGQRLWIESFTLSFIHSTTSDLVESQGRCANTDASPNDGGGPGCPMDGQTRHTGSFSAWP